MLRSGACGILLCQSSYSFRGKKRHNIRTVKLCEKTKTSLGWDAAFEEYYMNCLHDDILTGAGRWILEYIVHLVVSQITNQRVYIGRFCMNCLENLWVIAIIAWY